MIDQTITTPPLAPSSNDIPSFKARFDAFLAWMVVFVSQLVTLVSQINSTASTINSKEESATNSANTATVQAGIATTKAGEASASAASALSSKEAAEAIFDSFDDKYLGPKAVAPTVDNDGDPLSTGALYFKTTAPKGLYIYDAELDTWSSPTYIPTAHGSLSGRSDNDAHPMSAITGLSEALADKQASLVSGTNIKTINNTSILGGGDISVTTPDATETVKGKVELATPAEVQGGIDNVRAITSAGLFSIFTNSKSGNGYIKLPNGLILQWGNTGVVTANVQVTVTFPIAFTTIARVGGITTCSGTDAYIAASTALLNITDLASFKFHAFNMAGASYNWVAIGY